MGAIDDAAEDDEAGVPKPHTGRGVAHTVNEVWLQLAWELMGVPRDPRVGSPSRTG